MKKSEAFRAAQMAVLSSDSVFSCDKLEILRVLMDSEDLALFSEKQKEKEDEDA